MGIFLSDIYKVDSAITDYLVYLCPQELVTTRCDIAPYLNLANHASQLL